MANRRMVPTGFFRDPDIMNLREKDSQLILLGLILAADDEGRGVAHAHLLARELDYAEQTIEQGLQDLTENDLLLLYTVGKHRYYGLTRWWDWQTIPQSRRTPSRFPAPPEQNTDHVQTHDCTMSTDCMQRADSVQTHDCTASTDCMQRADKKLPNISKVNLSKEGEEERISSEPSNVIPLFPPPTSDSTNGQQEEGDAHSPLTAKIAGILKIPLTEALTRVVHDYQQDPTLSLLGEADAAREYLDDPRRNIQHKTMTPAFFRRWLKREREQSATTRTGTDRAAPPSRGTPAPARKSLMNLEAHYRQQQGGSSTNLPSKEARST